MKWLSANWTTMAMATLLSLVTVALLTDPGEEVVLLVNATFSPEVRPDAGVGSLEYSVEGKRITNEIQVSVTSDKPQASVLRLTCRPILDRGKFPEDATSRKIEYRVTEKDFNLTSEQAKRIRIEPLTLSIGYAPIMTKTLPIDVSTNDLRDVENSPYKVERIRAMPPYLTVRLPVDKAGTLKSLAIKPVSIMGREESFTILGALNTEHAEMKDVRTSEQFEVAVDLRRPEFEKTFEGIPLAITHVPAPPGVKVELIDRPALKVVVDGPKDLVEKVRPDQLIAFVIVDWDPEWKPGQKGFPIKFGLKDDVLRKSVHVTPAAGEPIMALVQVTRSERND